MNESRAYTARLSSGSMYFLGGTCQLRFTWSTCTFRSACTRIPLERDHDRSICVRVSCRYVKIAQVASRTTRFRNAFYAIAASNRARVIFTNASFPVDLHTKRGKYLPCGRSCVDFRTRYEDANLGHSRDPY